MYLYMEVFAATLVGVFLSIFLSIIWEYFKNIPYHALKWFNPQSCLHIRNVFISKWWEEKDFIIELHNSPLSLTKSGRQADEIRAVREDEGRNEIYKILNPGSDVRERERRLNLVQLYFISVLPTINSGEGKTVCVVIMIFISV